MSEFLDQYGVADARKERRRKQVFLYTLATLILGVSGYFYFRTWSEERVMKEFLATLDRQDFQGAYRMFGCSQDKPCENYEPGRFTRDWGPDSPYAKGSAAVVEQVDPCGEGVVFLVKYPGAEPVSLWVDRSTKIISFAPWPQCPGRHLEIRRFFSNLFGKA